MKNYLTLIFVLTYCLNTYSYVINKSSQGKNIRWSTNLDRVDLYVSPRTIGAASPGITEENVKDILNESVSSWNQALPFTIKPIFQDNPVNTFNKSVLRFTSSTSFFGSGVLAVTSISYKPDSAVIISGDIYINESSSNQDVSFTKNKFESSRDKAYLGDIFTHEIGHLIGLSHTEQIGASMIFSVAKNQYEIGEDDLNGALDNYKQYSAPGDIQGRVLGGNHVPIFGSFVTIFSVRSNKALQSQSTNFKGEFHFKNLELDDSYYISTRPLKNLETLPNYYSTVQRNYCSGNSYQHSFYSTCEASGQSRPQTFLLTKSVPDINVGDITIRCDSNLDTNYLSRKRLSNFSENLLNEDRSSTQEVFTGYFSTEEIEQGLNGKGDLFQYDLRSFDWGVNIASSYRLKMGLLTTDLTSAIKLVVYAKRADEIFWKSYQGSLDPASGRLNTAIQFDLNISSVTANNLFEFKVYPVGLNFSEEGEIFASVDDLAGSVSLYSLTAQVGQYTVLGFSHLNPEAHLEKDNESCLEGSVSFTAQPNQELASGESQRGELSPNTPSVSCGTVDTQNTGGKGMFFSFLLGSIFFIFLSNFRRFSHKSLP